MTKEEAQKWGLILLAYGYGDKCDIKVKEKNNKSLSDLIIAGANQNDFEILERTSPACPPNFLLHPIHFEYEEKEDENFISKIIKFPKEQIFDVAKIFIKAALSSESAESDYFKMGRVVQK